MTDYKKKSDDELLQYIKDGNQNAYAEIYRRYSEVLFRHAVRLLQDRSEAEDVIQEVFLMIWEKRNKIFLANSLSSYLYNTVRNRIFNHLTHQKVIVKYLDSIREFIKNGHYSTDETIREKELTIIIEKEIAALPPKMREIFLLSREEDLSYKDIGRQLHISDKTVKQQVYNAVKILKIKITSFLSIFPFL